ncbi:MAG TPA: hypothetical protein PKD83_14460 [Ignavibacteria bacterium]|nr:hypothetical protein [Ignavibacteria bacterium]
MKTTLIKSVIVLITAVILTSCSGNISSYAPQSTDDQMSGKIAKFLANDYFKKDIKFIPADDRRFRYFAIDINGDGIQEYFIHLFTPYFCGSGGCTFLIIDNKENVISKFTVTEAPVYVSKEKENNWNVLYLMSGGKYRKVVHNNNSYPGNPSLLETTDYKPGPGDIAIFDDKKNPSKTFSF